MIMSYSDRVIISMLIDHRACNDRPRTEEAGEDNSTKKKMIEKKDTGR